MKIKTLTYRENDNGLYIKNIDFDDITLLVGISGVGKTRILRSLMNVIDIVIKEKSLPGVEWKLIFEIDGNEYRWSGKFSDNSNIQSNIINVCDDKELDLNNNVVSITEEELLKNDKILFSRKDNAIIFANKDLPKLNINKSLLTTLSGEENINEIITEFKKVYFMNLEEEILFGINASVFSEPTTIKRFKTNTLQKIRNLQVPVLIKLAFTYYYDKQAFNKIKEEFRRIFSQVEDIRFTTINGKSKDIKTVILEIKERNTTWIPQNLMSAGMIKTLVHIAKMKLLPNGSIIIIDEFENGLGINCIDNVAEEIEDNERDFQFIITSHHPYIINEIGITNWKIVMRKGSNILVKKANELNLGNSRHEAFKQLINSREYRKGIE